MSIRLHLKRKSGDQSPGLIGPFEFDKMPNDLISQHFPHVVKVDFEMLFPARDGKKAQAIEWLTDRYGSGDAVVFIPRNDLDRVEEYLDTNCKWVINAGHYCFQDEKAAFEFKLTWC